MKLAGTCSRLSSAQAGSMAVVCRQPPGRHGLVGAALSAFIYLFFLVVTLLHSLFLSVPLELGPHSNKPHLEHHGLPGKMRKRGRHTPVGRKRREENAKKMWSAGEKDQKEQEGKEVIGTEESGKGRVRGRRWEGKREQN